ncbi:aldose 1-epimerase [Faunimonas pinastri]|uniref:Aldose 1-epimerase n=1 Tax=Faunimonas pinastri TaxID=1855383 RepID=A0A1H9JEE6_9HYPH|nr:aldose epimerase family protein [Faunimonas pinastri]SEQ85117.1 aldose 1-epimerase [Faunimonas pinastri]
MSEAELGTRREFGTLADGTVIEAVAIGAGPLRAEVITWGAVIRDVRFEGVDHPLVLGFERLEDYVGQSPYFGATVGRFANRIARGRFKLDGEIHELPCNDGDNHLHGGPHGFGTRVWTIESLTQSSVLLKLVSADGDQGYPGEVTAECSYEVSADGTLIVSYSASTDRETVVNLAQHTYFNLDGAPTILDHKLQLAADAYLPVDSGYIPTGELKPVEGTPFDFRSLRVVRPEGAEATPPYDNNFCLAAHRRPEPAFAARLEGRDGTLSMELWTTEPGVQFYDGFQIAVTAPGLGGRTYPKHAGLCLEAQLWPDAPNQSDFPSATLKPGETYWQRTEFRFRA